MGPRYDPGSGHERFATTGACISAPCRLSCAPRLSSAEGATAGDSRAGGFRTCACPPTFDCRDLDLLDPFYGSEAEPEAPEGELREEQARVLALRAAALLGPQVAKV